MPKKTFECAEAAEAILITQVKDNQEALRKQLHHGCQLYKRTGCFDEAIDKGHGRLEQRTYEVFKALPMLHKWQDDWPYIREVIRVTRYREEIRKSAPVTSTHYYVSNGELDAQRYAKVIREHWWIENKNHHVKDVAFREDSTTKYRNPYIYSTCIDFSLNMMRIKGISNIKSSLFKNSLDFIEFYGVIKDTL